MSKWDLEIQRAKAEIVGAKKLEWLDDWRYKHPDEHPPEPPDFKVKAWFTATWDNGFVVVDLEELKKMPKRKRDKILSLGVR